ncbi:DUF726 domain-containing protein [Halobacteriales archaeon QS_1_68_20]|nr:MAG: DUF726 domain-containing protein [Halobacteriales archaeon QS_1_68_20]
MRRRTFVKSTAAAGSAAVLGTGVAMAGKGGDDDLTAPNDYPGVSTRDHFSINWYGAVESERGTYAYDYRGDWAKYDHGNELQMFVHGWRSDDEENEDIDGAYTNEQALIEQGYDETGVVYSWDSDKGGGIDDGWYEAQEIAQKNGPKLANFLTDWAYHDGRPVRILAHSLGAQVVASAMTYLHSWGYYNLVEDVVLLGGAADNDECALEGDYGPSFEYAAKQVLNAYKTDDSVLEWAYSLGELDAAVGETDVQGTPPANWTSLNVTNVVPDHYSYPELKEDGGCMDIVTTYW